MTYSEIQAISPDGLGAIKRTVSGEQHQDYARVTGLASLYHKVITGDGIETLLKIFSRRETPVMFQQRCDITQHVTPAVCSPAMLPFYKVPRVNNIVDKIDFVNSVDFDKKRQAINNAIQNYYGEDSLDFYMSRRFVELSFSDPNAFIVTEFMDGERDANGNLIDHVKPYPIEYTSAQCVNFEYSNNTLQWLVVCTADKKMPNKNRYVIYLKEWSISFTPIDSKLFDYVPIGTFQDTVYNDESVAVYKAGENDAYVVRAHNHKSKMVPAKRIGYISDLITNGRTFVSPINPGMSYLMKSIQGNSEMDLTMKLHAYLQKFSYENPCTAVGCDKGTLATGDTCGVCKGTGISPTHTTTQDEVTMPMPRKKDDMIPLSDLSYYPNLQVELLKFQEDYTSGLIPKFNAAVFNSNVFTKNKVEFAAEVGVSMESVYDTLHPFAIQYASTRTYQVKVISNYLDIFDLEATYTFPKDFRFRTRGELLAELNAAGSASSSIKKAISTELTEALFADSPDELKRMRVKDQFYPFQDKSQSDIVFGITNGSTDEYNEKLWFNFSVIFERAELAAKKDGVYLYDLTVEKIQPYIDAQVEVFMPDSTEGSLVLPSAESVQDSGLNGAQIAGMIQIVKDAVAEQIPIEAAKEILAEAFPTMDKARISIIVNSMYGFEPAPPPSTGGFGGN